MRYDGGHKLEIALADLAGRVEWVAVCPEVEVGLASPRPSIRLETRYVSGPRSQPSIRLRVIDSREDLTEAMTAYAEKRIAALLAMGLSGFVLKSRSPSCGLDVAVTSQRDGGAGRVVTGSHHPGLFAATLLRMALRLPIVEEDRLRKAGELEIFLDRVYECHRWAHRGG